MPAHSNSHMRFNPLPPPKRGETRRLRLRVSAVSDSFNPLPPPKRGETGCRVPQLQ